MLKQIVTNYTNARFSLESHDLVAKYKNTQLLHTVTFR